jgi:glycosyltransferase involved in cell wall biosynthesis
MVRQLSADGWECHVAVPGTPRLASEYALAGAHLHIVPMARLTTSGSPVRWAAYAWTWPRTVWRLAALVGELRVDVVHTNSLHSWYGWAAAEVRTVPHVWHAREIVFQSRKALLVERWLTRHFADRVIAVSRSVASQLSGATIEVITDEADPRRFNPLRAGRFRRGADIDDGVALVGSVARIDTWKGFDTLLDAFDRLRTRRPDAELVVVGAPVPGKEGYAESIRSRAEKTPGVHWMGSRSDVEEVMADLDVFVQISSQPEPFGLVVVEALASGVPVVAGNEGGPLEIVGDEAARRAIPAGQLVPPDDPVATELAIAALLPESSSTTSRQARRPLRRAGEAKFAELFDEVIAGRSPNRSIRGRIKLQRGPRTGPPSTQRICRD